jgi:3-methyladenine DNA glycosylase Tag
MQSFAAIRARAVERKGGEHALASLLYQVSSPSVLSSLDDHRVLAEMTKRIFCAGFVWSVIDNKWPAFEAAFLGFEPKRLLFEPDEFWEGLVSDARIVRHAQKIMAVRHNARFVSDVAREHGSFGRLLASWPLDDHLGLLELLAKRGARLGGHTGQYFLRFIGRDCFMTSRDVVACLREAGLDISQKPSSKKDLARIQAQFNAWAEETGLPYTHLSRICAMSTGNNYDATTLHARAGMDE